MKPRDQLHFTIALPDFSLETKLRGAFRDVGTQFGESHFAVYLGIPEIQTTQVRTIENKDLHVAIFP
jgi:hypothetical protein